MIVASSVSETKVRRAFVAIIAIKRFADALAGFTNVIECAIRAVIATNIIKGRESAFAGWVAGIRRAGIIIIANTLTRGKTQTLDTDIVFGTKIAVIARG